MKFLPHFDAKLEYLVHRLDLQPNGARSPQHDDNPSGESNLRRLDDFRSPTEARAKRASGKSSR